MKEIFLKEDLCKKTVYPNEQWGAFHGHQCNKKAVKDGYCAIHHPDYEKAKQEAQSKRWEEESKVRHALWKLQNAAPRMKELLKDAALQIQYLQEKFGETGSVNAVLARIDALLAELEAK